MSQDRRSFLSAVGGAALLASHPRALAAVLSSRRAKLDSVGIQLYTVRRAAATDLAGVLRQIATIGYREVEFAGFYNHPAADVRGYLDATGLRAPSAHIALEQIETNPAKTFDDAHTVGLEWITVPSLPRGPHVTADDWKHVADQFNRGAAAAKAAGFRFAFHNHNDIVHETNGILPIDILMRETDPALVSYQMDIYWAVSGGAKPIELLSRYPNRFRMLHIKDGKPPYTDASQTVVGQGDIDFKPILAAAKHIDHYFVESDSAADPLAFAAASYKYLASMEY